MKYYKQYRNSNSRLRFLQCNDKIVTKAYNDYAWNIHRSLSNRGLSYFSCDRNEYLNLSKNCKGTDYMYLHRPQDNILVIDCDIKCSEDRRPMLDWLNSTFGTDRVIHDTETGNDIRLSKSNVVWKKDTFLGCHLFLKVDYDSNFKDGEQIPIGKCSAVDIFYSKNQLIRMGSNYETSYIRLWTIPYVDNKTLLDSNIISTRKIAKRRENVTISSTGQYKELKDLILSYEDLSNPSHKSYGVLARWCRAYEIVHSDDIVEELFDWLDYHGKNDNYTSEDIYRYMRGIDDNKITWNVSQIEHNVYSNIWV